MRILTIQKTVNHEIDKVEGTCRHAYVEWIEDAANSDGDACPIGILFMRFELADNHGVENFFSSVLRDIFKLDEAEGVCAFHVLVLGDFLTLSYSLA